MTLPVFAHSRPLALDEAVAAVGRGGIPYAGGTELLAAMKMGLVEADELVDLKRVDALRGVTAEGGTVVIGASTPHAEVARSALVRQRLPLLAHLVRHVGNPRVRWQGTVGGNLCFAEPRSDLVPGLIALGAEVELRSPAGTRTAPLEALIVGPFFFDRAPEELVTRITVDADRVGWQRYERIQLLERPTAGVALVEREHGWRLTVGAACHTPAAFDVDALEGLEAGQVAAAIDPIDDLSGSADYKRTLVSVLVKRVLTAARQERTP